MVILLTKESGQLPSSTSYIINIYKKDCPRKRRSFLPLERIYQFLIHFFYTQKETMSHLKDILYIIGKKLIP